MRIVVVSPSLPLPFGGADARWLHVMAGELARRNHEVDVISCTQHSEAEVLEAELMADSAGFGFRHIPLILDETMPTRKAKSLRRPFSEYARSHELRRAIEHEEGKGYDILHTEHLFPSWVTYEHPKTVTYLHHLEVVDWWGRSDLTRREAVTLAQMRRASSHLLRRNANIIAATPRLARVASYVRRDTENRVPVVPIALDTSLYEVQPQPEEPVVGVIGSMHWYPSRSAAVRVLTNQWPHIHSAVPTARLLVAGWGSDTRLSGYFPLGGAELLGPVEKPTDFFSRISLLLYPPVQGSGMKVKVLESFAYGKPAVSNGDGFEGLHSDETSAAVLATTDQEFIARTSELLANPATIRDMGTSARTLVEDHYSPEPAIDRLLLAYERLGLL